MFAPKQRVETPVTAASCAHIQEKETEQDSGDALILNGRQTIRRMKLPIRYRHHSGQDEGDGPRCDPKGNRYSAKELEQPTDTGLG
jgi:hypothetical protein